MTSNAERYLEKKLKELEQDRVNTEAGLVDIRDKITRADAKKAEQKGDEYFHKWSEILRGLEAELDASKRHLNAVEAEIIEKTKKLAEHRERNAAERERQAALPKRILDMTQEEIADLSLEDLMLLQQHDLEEAGFVPAKKTEGTEPQGDEAATAPSPADTPQAAAEEKRAAGAELITESSLEGSAEPARQDTPAEPASDPPAKEAPADAVDPKEKQRLFLSALKKSNAGKIRELTFGEFEALVDFYRGLSREADSDPKHARVRQSVANAIVRADQAYKHLRQRLREAERS